MEQVNLELLEKLSHAGDYRSFLNLLLDDLKKRKGLGVRADISRKAGFASRSFLTEVLSGKKGLSRDAMQRLKVALKLTGHIGKLFEALVYKSHPNIQPSQKTSREIDLAIAGLSNQILKNKNNPELARPHLTRPEVFQVYAALGTENLGADLEEIKRKTGLTSVPIRTALKSLVESKAVRVSEGRYFAISANADSLNYENRAALAEMIHKVCSGIQRNRKQMVEDRKNLNIYSAFSVNRNRVFDLKKDLEKALMSVLDEYQDDSGDSVEQVFLSLFNTPI